MPASTVSPPTAVTRSVKLPMPLRQPPMTASPGFFATGSDSPVISASSTLERPSSTMPSVGIRSPGRTRRMSPTTTSSMGTTNSRPSRRTVAVSGCSSISLRIASLARPLAFSSQ